MKAWSLFSKKPLTCRHPRRCRRSGQLSATNTLRRELVNVALRSTAAQARHTNVLDRH